MRRNAQLTRCDTKNRSAGGGCCSKSCIWTMQKCKMQNAQRPQRETGKPWVTRCGISGSIAFLHCMLCIAQCPARKTATATATAGPTTGRRPRPRSGVLDGVLDTSQQCHYIIQHRVFCGVWALLPYCAAAVAHCCRRQRLPAAQRGNTPLPLWANCTLALLHFCTIALLSIISYPIINYYYTTIQQYIMSRTHPTTHRYISEYHRRVSSIRSSSKYSQLNVPAGLHSRVPEFTATVSQSQYSRNNIPSSPRLCSNRYNGINSSSIFVAIDIRMYIPI